MKKTDFIKAVESRTEEAEPVFAVTTGRSWTMYYIASKRPNDSYSTMMKEGDNGVWLQQVRFMQEDNKLRVDVIGHSVMKRLNAVQLHSVGYEQAWAKMQAAADTARREREERDKAHEVERQARLRDERVVAELQPIIKELLASTGVSVSGAYGDSVKITVSASQLEGFIELLKHSVSE